MKTGTIKNIMGELGVKERTVRVWLARQHEGKAVVHNGKTIVLELTGIVQGREKVYQWGEKTEVVKTAVVVDQGKVAEQSTEDPTMAAKRQRLAGLKLDNEIADQEASLKVKQDAVKTSELADREAKLASDRGKFESDQKEKELSWENDYATLKDEKAELAKEKKEWAGIYQSVWHDLNALRDYYNSIVDTVKGAREIVEPQMQLSESFYAGITMKRAVEGKGKGKGKAKQTESQFSDD